MNSKKKTQFYFSELSSESANRLKISIGKFLDRSDIVPWRNEEGKLLSVQAFNGLNREEIAKLYALKILKTSTLEGLKARDFYFSQSLTWEKFMMDLVRYIDLRLPVHLWSHLKKKGNQSLSELRQMYPGIHRLKGIEFAHRVNYIMELRYLEARENGKKHRLLEIKLKELSNLAKTKGYRLNRGYFKAETIFELINAIQNDTLTEQQIALYFQRIEKDYIPLNYTENQGC